MEIKKKQIPGSKIEFEISIGWDVVKESIKDAYRGMERYAKTDGFRKGRIPKYIFEARFSKEAEERAIRHLIEKTAQEILNNEKIELLDGPWVERVNFKKENPLLFKIGVEVTPNFEIPDYKNIKLSFKRIKIEDKEIERHLEVMRKEKSELREKEGKIKKGDIAVIDLVAYSGSKKPIEHHGLYIEIGSSSFPKKLEDELIGLCKNDEKTFEVEMSKDNIARFKVKVLGVKERILPKLSDDFAKNMGNFKNIKELKERIRENLTKIEEEKQRNMLKEQLIEELLKKTQFDAPESLVIEEYKRMFLTLLYNLEKENISFERFLSLQNKSEDAFHKELKEEAGKRIRTLLLLEKIAERENITVSDTEYEEWVKRSFSPHAIESALSPEKRKTLEKDLRIEKTLEFLISKAK